MSPGHSEGVLGNSGINEPWSTQLEDAFIQHDVEPAFQPFVKCRTILAIVGTACSAIYFSNLFVSGTWKSMTLSMPSIAVGGSTSDVWTEIYHFEDEHCQVLSNSNHMVGFYNETNIDDPLDVTYFYADPNDPAMVGPPPALARSKYELQVLRGGQFVAPLGTCNAFLAKGKPFYEMNTVCDIDTGHTYHQQFSDAACKVSTSVNKFNVAGKCYKSTVPGMRSYTISCRGRAYGR